MHVLINQVLVLAVIIVTNRAQLTDIAGSTSVSVSPIDATCGRTSADSYCRVDLAADASCVIRTCRTVCEDTGPTYIDLLRGVSGFNFDGSVTNTTKDFGGGNVTVAVFQQGTRLAFLRGRVNMTDGDDVTLSFWTRPDDMDSESSVIDIHGADYGQRVLNVRLSANLRLTIVYGTINVTDRSWGIPRHVWSHIAIQLGRSGTNVYLNGSKMSQADVSHTIQIVKTPDLKMKIGQSFAGDITQTHRVTAPGECEYEPQRKVQPSNSDDFCQDKANGWYALQNIHYAQCLTGRRLNVHTCGSALIHRRSGTYLQCVFCPSSCQCETGCTPENANKRCDALGFVCRDGEGKPHPEYCDQYYICEHGEYVKRKCNYPERWSTEHERCEAFQSVDCGRRLPKHHPCDRENTAGYVHGSPDCIPAHYHGNCTGQKDGLYYKKMNGYCSLYGCIKSTLVRLYGYHAQYDPYKVNCPHGYGINPASGRCEEGANCLSDTIGHTPTSSYLCPGSDIGLYRNDCRNYWRCQHGRWTVESCPEGLVWLNSGKQCVSDTAHCSSSRRQDTVDLKERQFLGQLADVKLYNQLLSDSEISKLYDPLASCKQWGRDAHPVAYVIDSDPSTYWLSPAGLSSVDLTFGLQHIYKLEDISMTFIGPVPLVVSIFKKVTEDDSWQLCRVFRDDCSDVLKCTQMKRSLQLDGDRLTYNLLEASLGPLQRRASSLRIRLSGHRHEGAAQLRNISYFGLYSVALSRRISRRCGTFGYVLHASSSSCLLCSCDVRGVIDGNVECNEIGGQCACKRYVTGHRCDLCLSGYDNIRQSDPGGCSNSLPTTVFDQKTSPPPDSLAVTTTSFDHQPSPTNSSLATKGSSTPWLLYTTPLYIVVVVVIVIIIAVICVRSRRRQQRDSDKETENPATEPQPAHERSTPMTLSDAVPDYTLMTRPGSDKIQRRLAGQTNKKLVKVDPDYLEPSIGVVNSPDYQSPVLAVPLTATPIYSGLTKHTSEPSSAAASTADYQRPVPAVPVSVTPTYAKLTSRHGDSNPTKVNQE